MESWRNCKLFDKVVGFRLSAVLGCSCSKFAFDSRWQLFCQFLFTILSTKVYSFGVPPCSVFGAGRNQSTKINSQLITRAKICFCKMFIVKASKLVSCIFANTQMSVLYKGSIPDIQVASVVGLTGKKTNRSRLSPYTN